MSLFLHQIWRNVALHHLLSNGCSAVNGCRQNESPNREICTDQASFTIQNSSKQICVWILKWEDNSGWSSSLEELLWIMDWILVYRWNILMDLFLANTQLWLKWCGLLDVFISCLDSHSDGTHSLQSIHCWDTDAETHFYKSDKETNSS